jgi:hypothetical protein
VADRRARISAAGHRPGAMSSARVWPASDLVLELDLVLGRVDAGLHDQRAGAR